MKINHKLFIGLFLFALILSACQPGSKSSPPAETLIITALPASPTTPFTPTQPPPTQAPPTQPSPTQPPATTMPASSRVRTCDYVPGKSTPAQIPPGTEQPAFYPTPVPITFTPSQVTQKVRQAQMTVYDQIVKDVNEHYYAADVNGVDWKGIQAKYKALIQKGLKQEDFYQAMNQMVAELGDGSSVYLSPADLASQTMTSTEQTGIGILLGWYPDLENKPVYVQWVYPGGPAEQAGIKSHDALLSVDGLSVLDENGNPRLFGPAGSTVTVTMQTPGQAPRDVKLVRSALTNKPYLDYCLVSGTHIGYIRWSDPDNTSLAQTMDALKQMSAEAPLQGLIIDIRDYGISQLNALEPLMSLFTSGEIGTFIPPRGDTDPILYETDPARDVAGSQKLPLVVLQDHDTYAAPLLAGALQLAGRARIVGQTAPGRLFDYMMYTDEFIVDGSSLSLANKVFQPAGKTPDYWSKNGVVPGVPVSGLWYQYTEANDPYLAKAIELLMQK